MIARLDFMGQTYRNIPILRTRPSALKAANLQDFNVKLGTCFEQVGKWLCMAELTPKP